MKLGIDRNRVSRFTGKTAQAAIDSEIDTEIAQLSQRPVAEIHERIRQLTREWDIERILETNASLLALAGVLLAAKYRQRWPLALSGAVLGFLCFHGVVGWCPPIPFLRRLGVRTRREIDRETYALKFLRGDFKDLDDPKTAKEVARLTRAVRA